MSRYCGNISNINILMGLPGSGKTTWANNYVYNKSASYRYCIIHFDDFMVDHKYIPIHEIFKKVYISEYTDTLILDGLFLNSNNIEKQLKDIINILHNDNLNVYIHFWKENREYCLSNDKGRRSKSQNSIITINNAKLEEPNIEYLKSKFPNTNFKEIIYHTIIKATMWQKFFEPYLYCRSGSIVCSSDWCLGGTAGSCWSDSLSTLTPEPQPEDFKEFDELIEKVCPNISFMQYKKIKREIVSIKESSYGDYYGGVEYSAHYEMDLKKLYNLLIEMGLIHEDE